MKDLQRVEAVMENFDEATRDVEERLDERREQERAAEEKLQTLMKEVEDLIGQGQDFESKVTELEELRQEAMTTKAAGFDVAKVKDNIEAAKKLILDYDPEWVATDNAREIGGKLEQIRRQLEEEAKPQLKELRKEEILAAVRNRERTDLEVDLYNRRILKWGELTAEDWRAAEVVGMEAIKEAVIESYLNRLDEINKQAISEKIRLPEDFLKRLHEVVRADLERQFAEQAAEMAREKTGLSWEENLKLFKEKVSKRKAEQSLPQLQTVVPAGSKLKERKINSELKLEEHFTPYLLGEQTEKLLEQRQALEKEILGLVKNKGKLLVKDVEGTEAVKGVKFGEVLLDNGENDLTRVWIDQLYGFKEGFKLYGYGNAGNLMRKFADNNEGKKGLFGWKQKLRMQLGEKIREVDEINQKLREKKNELYQLSDEDNRYDERRGTRDGLMHLEAVRLNMPQQRMTLGEYLDELPKKVAEMPDPELSEAQAEYMTALQKAMKADKTSYDQGGRSARHGGLYSVLYRELFNYN
jgi:hypothetical protein